MPLGRVLDPLHIFVAEPEMMTDLVDQHMADHLEQILAALAPVIEDRPAVEEDHVELCPRVADTFVRQRDAAIEPQEVERAVEPHRSLGLAVGEILDPDRTSTSLNSSHSQITYAVFCLKKKKNNK